ncbi:MAG: hypothetical protein ABIJ97_09220 [Bacteroidota bacterium]
MKELKLNKLSFEKLLASAKHQFILKTDTDIYFLALGKEVHYSDLSIVAHNETKKTIEIIDYKNIKSGTVDGEKYLFVD